MQRAYFVSDLHLAGPDDPKTRLFTRFLKRLRGDSVSHLILLGDIFDMWLGDHQYFVDRFQAIVTELQQLRDGGTEIHYFEGNHDLHLERFWAEKLGITVHAGPAYLRIADRRLRLEHGDQMDPDDRGYHFLRWFLRTAVMRFLIYSLPGKLAAGIGERASATSRSYTSQQKTIARDTAVQKIREHAAKAHAVQPFDLMISGHVHVRDDHSFEAAAGLSRSVNLGTWLDAPCCFRLDAVSGELIELSEDVVAQWGAENSPATNDSP